MAKNVSKFLNELIHNNAQALESDSLSILKVIDKIGKDNADKANLLGLFFKNKFDVKQLNINDREYLKTATSASDLYNFSRLQTKESLIFKALAHFFLFLGIVAIVSGTMQLLNNQIYIGVGTKYIVPIVREGGYKIIIGVLSIIGSVSRLIYERKRSKLIQFLLDKH